MSACATVAVLYKYHQWLPLKREEGFPVLQQQEQQREGSGTACAVPAMISSSKPGAISHWKWGDIQALLCPQSFFWLWLLKDIFCTLQHFLSMLFKLEASPQGEMVLWASWIWGRKRMHIPPTRLWPSSPLSCRWGTSSQTLWYLRKTLSLCLKGTSSSQSSLCSFSRIKGHSPLLLLG